MSSENPTPTVEYRPVVGFPFYRVGNDGSVWSKITNNRYSSPIAGRWKRLNGTLNWAGYPRVDLCEHPGGKRHQRKVHRLVLEAFVGACPPGMVCCHDPDRTTTNNNISNLRWGTRADNNADMIKHGTIAKGSGKPQAKLTESDIPSIRKMLARNIPGRQIAIAYGVDATTIYKIKHQRRWRHVQ